MQESPPPQATAVQRRGLAVSILYAGLFILGGIALFLANVFLWADQTLLDTEEFSKATTEVLDQPTSQKRIGDVIAERVAPLLDAEERISARLPAELAFAAPVVERQLQGLLSEMVQAILAADTAIVQTITERLHARVVAHFESDDTILQAESDSLVIDLNEPIERVFERLNINEPQRLQDADFGQLLLVDGIPGLEATSELIRNRETLMFVFFVVAIGSFAGAVLLAPNRQRSFSVVGITIVLAGLATLAGVRISNLVLESVATEQIVLRELVRALAWNLRLQSLLFVVLGAVIVAIANPQTHRWLDSAADKVEQTVRRVGAVPAALVAAGSLTLVLFLS